MDFTNAWGELYSWFRLSGVPTSPVFLTKSRSATGSRGGFFRNGEGVNVKTNDGGCKEHGGEEGRGKGGKGREDIHGYPRRGYKGGRSHHGR